METNIMNRDTCWLRKKIDNPLLTAFIIEDRDAVTETIIREMAELFPQCERTDRQDSPLQFKIVINDAPSSCHQYQHLQLPQYLNT